MSHPQWQQSSFDSVSLLGIIDRDTVPSLWGYAQRWKTSEKEVQLSLKNVERIDSAGMVMLIHLIEHAKKQNCHIMLSFVPEQLSTLFKLSHIESVLTDHINIKQR
ncbi:STAS domain-containing protein [Vibrio genomosp. F10]|uniref:NTP-binding protein n=2 Tax=Vibrio genomosp. F10 TaxID=723171 RepID=A0A1B9R1V5_9VIBR|nr:lipid asymmetry maintenance protein MlaB [Vibrio genomosp. F10]OCH78309.1 NTP-binding protein [Vibrio genomosp. F10]OEE33754.1 NTP-binding protein [Vibrio genomosp. F10 str. ZF-129]OEE93971.1 NTP-binding protein [Vibrio genomosp. F10 str. 9ZC157]OEF03164.1 NTP-binding protein [Vibrio genomosp. F10 str. 9ZD137]OEF04255.1 NTP-binding protein [Vibrio genomosp. F10 str. 9ZB36]